MFVKPIVIKKTAKSVYQNGIFNELSRNANKYWGWKRSQNLKEVTKFLKLEKFEKKKMIFSRCLATAQVNSLKIIFIG